MIIVPKDREVRFSYGTMPVETPIGIREDGGVPVVEFDGHCYHILPYCYDISPYLSDPKLEAIDIESGEIVTLDFTEIRK